MSLDSLRKAARDAGPDIVGFVFDELCSAAQINFDARPVRKPVNDPVWKTIWLEGHEVAFLDAAPMQRLRRVRQLALAYLVYPGAQHTRFEHSIGAVEAASRMFDRLSRGVIAESDKREELRKVIRLAALTHDCGHPAFSHLGEGILATLFSKSFEALSSALAGQLKERSSYPGTPQNSKHSKAAEVMSALILAAPATEQFANKLGITDDQLLDAIALVLGFSIGKRTQPGNTLCSFMDFIVSGDLDVDKVDYVARDAYFSGIPISSDVDRLINQLTPALRANGRPDDNRYMFGVRQSGVSQVEMFVMTRAYLFDRLYRHPKIRAVEKFLQRSLIAEFNKRPPIEALRLLYSLSGDDGCLGQLASASSAITSLLARRVPMRALAVGPRLMVGFDDAIQQSSSQLNAAWMRASADFQETPDAFVAEVRRLAGPLSNDDMLFYDAPPRGTLTEDPDIWVTEPDSEVTARRINSMFDTERFSNAYHDRHAVNWIFSSQKDKVRVAAASALLLAKNYGLVLSPNAAREAKIKKDDFLAAVSSMYTQTSDEIQSEFHEAFRLIVNQIGDEIILPRIWISEMCPDSWTDLEKDEFSNRLVSQIEQIKLPVAYARELDNCLQVIDAILSHAHSILGHQRSTRFFESEDDFQQNVFQFLNHPTNRQSNWRVESGKRQTHGILDVSFDGADGRGVVPVELKSERHTFAKLVADHAGQARQYSAAEGYSHFSVLYVECLEDAPTKLCELVDVRGPTDATGPKLFTICLALPRSRSSASGQGKSSGPTTHA